MKRDTHKLGPLEMKILGMMADKDSVTVNDIRAQINEEGRSLAYTTVMTILGRLYEKSLVSREKQGRKYFYSVPNRTAKAKDNIFQGILRSLFHKERLRPIASFLDQEENITEAELIELEAMVKNKLKNMQEQ